ADGSEIPVVDAKFDTLIQPNQSDIDNGVPKSRTACMYALACKRLFESEFAVIARTVAYIEIKGKNGKPQVWRFIIRDPAKIQIEDFDAGATVTSEAVVFAAPKGRHRFGYEPLRRVQVQALPGAIRLPPRKKKSPRILRPLRDPGTGLFQFKTIHH